MVCQKCLYPHASPKGCISCGWVYDQNYHPALGCAPTETAQWILSTSLENLERLYGAREAQGKIAAAKALIGSMKVPDAPVAEPTKPEPPKPQPKKRAPKQTSVVISAVVDPVASPFSKPEDTRMHATEAEPPTG